MEPEKFREVFSLLEREVKKVIVGHTDVICRVLIALFSGGACPARRGAGSGQDPAHQVFEPCLGTILQTGSIYSRPHALGYYRDSSDHRE